MGHSKPGADSLIFAAARLLTYVVSIASAMVLARGLDLATFGAYAQGSQVITIAALVTAFGLADGVNFFQNRGLSRADRTAHVNSIFTLQIAIGLVAAGALFVFQDSVSGYYGNSSLKGLYAYLVLRPMLINLVSSLQVLLLSVARARFLAWRTIIVSVVKLAAVALVAFSLRDLRVIFAVMLVMDIITVVWFWRAFKEADFPLRLVLPGRSVLHRVFSLCLPMGVYVASTSVSREVGKLVIGGRSTVEWYAIYSNCATPLPFDAVSSSFLVVMIPTLTGYLAGAHLDRAKEILRNYVAVGYLTCFTLVAACIIVAPEALRFLYGEQYSAGLPIFELTLAASLFQFLNLSLVLSASGNTRSLMRLSLVSLFANASLAYLAFDWLGVLGPALASCLVAVATAGWLFVRSARVVGASPLYLLGGRSFAGFVAASAALSLVVWWTRLGLVGLGMPYWGVLASCGGLYVCIVLFAFRARLRRSIEGLGSPEEALT